jgi:hypothetical protein
VLFAEITEPLGEQPPWASFQQPLIAVRRLKRRCPLKHARAACDTLQRDLVRFGDFAGYVMAPAAAENHE